MANEVKGLFVAIYGWLGQAADPAGGQTRMIQRAQALGFECPIAEGGKVALPFAYNDSFGIVKAVKVFREKNASLPIVLEGDSCGANVIAQLVAWLSPIEVVYAAMIQPSTYCNFNYPNIAGTCKRARIFYSDFAHTGGLGTFIPQPQITPRVAQIDAKGWHLVNNGKTLYRADYVPAFHPDDEDISHVQDPIFSDLKELLDAPTG